MLATVAKSLKAQGLPDAQLEAELIVSYVLGVTRAKLYSDLQEEFANDHYADVEKMLAARMKKYPLAYLLGHREFYGREFYVAPAVMIPRQETETLVERALAISVDRTSIIVDVGTGSGVIAVTAAAHLPVATIVAVDISIDALKVAAINARHHEVINRVEFVMGDLLGPIVGPVDMVIANLPYIPEGDLETLQDEIRFYEPKLALTGGSDGLELIQRLLSQAPEVLAPGGTILLEIGSPQRKDTIRLVEMAFPFAHIQVLQDLAGWDRVLEITTDYH